MKFIVEFNPEFFNDIVEAVDWYNEKQAGLGDRLYKSIKQQTKKLSTSALNCAIKYDDTRCLGLDKFPYLIHYRVNEKTQSIKVEALFHTRRDPNIWNERTER